MRVQGRARRAPAFFCSLPGVTSAYLFFVVFAFCRVCCVWACLSFASLASLKGAAKAEGATNPRHTADAERKAAIRVSFVILCNSQYIGPLALFLRHGTVTVSPHPVRSPVRSKVRSVTKKPATYHSLLKASSKRSTGQISRPSIGCRGVFAFGIRASLKPNLAASRKRS